MVEDLHAAYWEEYEGGYRKAGTFIELCKQLIDELNATAREAQLRPPSSQIRRSRCTCTTVWRYSNVVLTPRNGR
jgi:hypothetical protein